MIGVIKCTFTKKKTKFSDPFDQTYQVRLVFLFPLQHFSLRRNRFFHYLQYKNYRHLFMISHCSLGIYSSLFSLSGSICNSVIDLIWRPPVNPVFITAVDHCLTVRHFMTCPCDVPGFWSIICTRAEK